MLAREWIVWDDPNDDATSNAFPCMGFADVRCDTHGEGEGWEELRALMLLAPEGSVGYGIPTGAGLCVRPGRHARGARRAGALHRKDQSRREALHRSRAPLTMRHEWCENSAEVRSVT